MRRAFLSACPFVLLAGAACNSGCGGATVADDGVIHSAAANDGGDGNFGDRGDAATRGADRTGSGTGNDTGDNDAGWAAGCHDDKECGPGAMMCSGPGETVCGGPAPPQECGADRDCAVETSGDAGPQRVCETGVCGDTRCVPKCSQDADCGAPLRACNTTTGHCGAKSCTATSCPVNFTCAGAEGCVRATCKTDAECSGACVNGQCFSGAGTCGYMPV